MSLVPAVTELILAEMLYLQVGAARWVLCCAGWVWVGVPPERLATRDQTRHGAVQLGPAHAPPSSASCFAL